MCRKFNWRISRVVCAFRSCFGISAAVIFYLAQISIKKVLFTVVSSLLLVKLLITVKITKWNVLSVSVYASVCVWLKQYNKRQTGNSFLWTCTIMLIGLLIKHFLTSRCLSFDLATCVVLNYSHVIPNMSIHTNDLLISVVIYSKKK